MSPRQRKNDERKGRRDRREDRRESERCGAKDDGQKNARGAVEEFHGSPRERRNEDESHERTADDGGQHRAVERRQPTRRVKRLTTDMHIGCSHFCLLLVNVVPQIRHDRHAFLVEDG